MKWRLQIKRIGAEGFLIAVREFLFASRLHLSAVTHCRVIRDSKDLGRRQT